MIIDTHTHIFSDEHYSAYLAKAKGAIDRILTIHLWHALEDSGKSGYFSLDEFLAFVKTKKNLRAVGSMDMEKDVRSQLQKLEKFLKSGKIVGIKLYPGYQYFYPSDKKVFPVAELCAKYNKPLIFHSGDFYDVKKTAVLKYSHPVYVDELATRYANCKIIIAHFGFPYHLETANVVSKNKNVFTDISGTIDEIGPKKAIGVLFSQYVNDLKRAFAYFPDVKAKTMFGTDYSGEKTTLNQVGPYIRLVENVWSKNERGRIFHDLAEKLFFS